MHNILNSLNMKFVWLKEDLDLNSVKLFNT